MSVSLTLLALLADGQLTWDVPAGCPDDTALRAEISRLLGGRSPDFAGVYAVGRVSDGGSGAKRWQLRLQVRTEQGTTERSFSSERCQTLVEAAALYVAIAVDPTAVLSGAAKPADRGGDDRQQDGSERGGEGGERDSDITYVDSSDPWEDFDPEPEERRGYKRERRPPAPELGVRVMGASGLGLFPGVGGGLGLGVSLRLFDHVRFEALAQYWFRRALRRDDQPSVGADLHTGFAELRVCPHARVRTVELGACVGADVGAHQARGVGLDTAQTARAPFASVLFGPAVAWHALPWLAVWLEPNLVVAVYRTRFEIDGVGDLATMGLIGGRVTLGVHFTVWKSNASRVTVKGSSDH